MPILGRCHLHKVGNFSAPNRPEGTGNGAVSGDKLTHLAPAVLTLMVVTVQQETPVLVATGQSLVAELLLDQALPDTNHPPYQ